MSDNFESPVFGPEVNVGILEDAQGATTGICVFEVVENEGVALPQDLA